MRTSAATGSRVTTVVVAVGIITLLSSSFSLTTAFNVQSKIPRRSKLSSPVLFASYLDSLSAPQQPPVPDPAPVDVVPIHTDVPQQLQQQQQESDIVSNYNGGFIIHDAIHSMKQSKSLYAPSGVKPLRTEIFNGDIVETIPGGVQPIPQGMSGALVGAPTRFDAPGSTRPSLPATTTTATTTSSLDEIKPFHFTEPEEQDKQVEGGGGGGAATFASDGQGATAKVVTTNTATTKEPIISSAETSSYTPSGFDKVLENRWNTQGSSAGVGVGGPTAYSPPPPPPPSSSRTTAGTANTAAQAPTYSAAAFARILQNREEIKARSGGAGGTPSFPSSTAASSPATSTQTSPTIGTAAAPTSNGIHYATRSDFNLDQLQPKGPRKNADVGTPHDSTKLLMKGEGEP